MLGDSSFPLVFPMHFSRMCLGISALVARQYSLLFMESSSYDWVKKPVIWGLEYRQQGPKALNVVCGPGILAGDGNIGWMGNSGWQPLITQDIGITNLISGLPFRNRLCFSLLSNWMLSIPIAIACQVVQHSIASVSSHIWIVNQLFHALVLPATFPLCLLFFSARFKQ